MEQSPWKDDCYLTGQEIPVYFMEPEYLLPSLKEPITEPYEHVA
jgi:hypothetical protein